MSDEKAKEKAKKQIPLRVSASLYAEIAQWAEDDFRSINGQIEFLLTECVKYRKKKDKELKWNKTQKFIEISEKRGIVSKIRCDYSLFLSILYKIRKEHFLDTKTML